MWKMGRARLQEKIGENPHPSKPRCGTLPERRGSRKRRKLPQRRFVPCQRLRSYRGPPAEGCGTRQGYTLQGASFHRSPPPSKAPEARHTLAQGVSPGTATHKSQAPYVRQKTHPRLLPFAGIKMHLPIRDDGKVSSTLQELHYFLAAPSHRRPTGFRLRILFQSSQISSVVLKIDLFQFSLCRHSNRKALLFEQYRLPVFDKGLLVDSQ
jgi:hypothetical protein